MTEQDAAESDDGGQGDTSGTAETDGDGEDAAETVGDIADEAVGDPEGELAEIIGASSGDGTGSKVHDTESVSDPGDVEIEDALLERVEEAQPAETARVIALLRQRVDALENQVEVHEEEVDDLESRLKRKQADFQNYKKRQKERLEKEKRRATEDLVTRLLDVRDNLERALEQDESADIRGGVETTLKQFDGQLQRENVERVEPEPGEEVDPRRHEALATIASDQPEDTIAQVHRPGYEMAGKLIRPAQVAVSDGSKSGEESDGES